jgi:hypothetical protein
MGVVGGVDYVLNDHHDFRLDTTSRVLPSDGTDSVRVDEDNEYSALVSYGYKF